MNDPEIRAALFRKFGFRNFSEKKVGLSKRRQISGLQRGDGDIMNSEFVYHELGMSEGRFRADVAVFEYGITSGYEIKGDRDNLNRLERQADAYSKIFDACSVVCTARHIHRVVIIVPETWGIIAAVEKDGIASVKTRRPAMAPMNSGRFTDASDNVVPSEFVKLLWRDEAYGLLKKHGLGHRMSTRGRAHMWSLLVEKIEWPVLKIEIMKTITERTGWK